MHAYESRSGRLRLQVEAAGEAHILLLQPVEGDGKVWLEGGSSSPGRRTMWGADSGRQS